jgi:hypothetical protein
MAGVAKVDSVGEVDSIGKVDNTGEVDNIGEVDGMDKVDDTGCYGVGGKRWIIVDVMVDAGYVSLRDLRTA